MLVYVYVDMCMYPSRIDQCNAYTYHTLNQDSHLFNFISYHIEIYINAIQPKGGVKKGEIFKSPALNMESESVHDPTGRVKRMVDMNAPCAHWRDGLFDIFANGLFHPMLLTSFFCTHGEYT